MDLAQTVRELLEKHPQCRESDSYLIAMYWRKEIGSTTLELSKLAHDEVTKPESIRRSRQLFQATYPHLRGDNYKGRHENEHKIKQAVKAGPERFGGVTQSNISKVWEQQQSLM